MKRGLYAFAVVACLTGCERQANDTANDPAATKFASVCQDCHGARGEGRGIYPRLAGRSADELAARLRQYKSGHKTERMSDAMRPFAQALSEPEIDRLAAWLAKQ